MAEPSALHVVGFARAEHAEHDRWRIASGQASPSAMSMPSTQRPPYGVLTGDKCRMVVNKCRIAGNKCRIDEIEPPGRWSGG